MLKKCFLPAALKNCLKFLICGEFVGILRLFLHNSCTLIFCNSFLKEVCLSFQRNVFHEVKWIFCIKNLLRKSYKILSWF